MTTQLFWVFNQALPAWAVTFFLLTQKNTRSSIFVMALLLLHAPFPFIGLIPLILFIVFYTLPHEAGVNICSKDGLNFILKEMFTFQNFIGGAVIGFVTYMYISSNYAGSQIALADILAERNMYWYSLGFIFEALILAILIRLSGIKHPLLPFTVVILASCIFLKIGYASDFMMRGSIPSLIILCLFAMAALKKSIFEKKKRRCCHANCCFGGRSCYADKRNDKKLV